MKYLFALFLVWNVEFITSGNYLDDTAKIENRLKTVSTYRDAKFWGQTPITFTRIGDTLQSYAGEIIWLEDKKINISDDRK
jgi:hypothetical protein